MWNDSKLSVAITLLCYLARTINQIHNLWYSQVAILWLDRLICYLAIHRLHVCDGCRWEKIRRQSHDSLNVPTQYLFQYDLPYSASDWLNPSQHSDRARRGWQIEFCQLNGQFSSSFWNLWRLVLIVLKCQKLKQQLLAAQLPKTSWLPPGCWLEFKYTNLAPSRWKFLWYIWFYLAIGCY